MSTYNTIRAATIEDGTVLEVVLDKPKGNVLDREMMGELNAALAAHEDPASGANSALRLVLLRGEGKHFSFGASVEEHRRDMAPEMLAGFHALMRRLASYPVPVAALVQGQCLGGGFEVVLCCHFLFADETAKLGCPEIKLAVFPPVLAALGAHRLGSLIAERMLLTGEILDAATCERLGFLTRLFNKDEDARDGVLAWYRETLRPLSAFSLRQGTRSIREATGWLDVFDKALAATERQYVGELLASHDGNEGIDAFLGKRKPDWKDA